MFTEKIVIVKPVRYDDLDEARILTLRGVLKKYQFKGRGGRLLNLITLRRWANPKKGLRPAGVEGPTVVLPMLMRGKELLSMPEWVEWFIKECNRVREQSRLRSEIN